MKAPKINKYQDGGKATKPYKGRTEFPKHYDAKTGLHTATSTGEDDAKLTPEEWNYINKTTYGRTIHPQYAGETYPAYLEKGSRVEFDPATQRYNTFAPAGVQGQSGQEGSSAVAPLFNYSYKGYIPQSPPRQADVSDKVFVGNMGQNNIYRMKATGETVILDPKGNVVPPVTRAEGGSIKAPFLKKKVVSGYFGGGNVLTEDEKRQKFVMKGGKKYDPSGKEVPLTPDQKDKLAANQQQNAQLKQQAGQTLGAYGTGYYANQGMTGNEGKDLRTSTLGAVSNAGAIGGVIGGVAAIGDQIGEPTRKDLEQTDAQGNVKNKQGAIQGAMIGTTFSPSKRLEYEGGLTDVTGEAYIKSIESKAKEKIAAEQFGKEQAARQQQFAAEGGTIKGPGTGKSDSILSRVANKGIPANSFIVPAENNGLAKKIRKEVLGDNPNKDAKFQKLNGGGEAKADVAVSNGEHLFTPAEKKKITAKLGEEILEELAPNAEENENEKTKGGEMIKRADGSYSKRGLWDNIRANSGSGKRPTPEMLKQEKEIKSEYADGGYVVEKSSERKGKTHKVTGPDGTVKYFGDANLGQHPNDPERKKAFYARHEENLKNNPYFRAFARETWKDGGTVGSDLSAAKAKQMLHDKTAQGHPLTDKQRKFFGWVAGGRKADGGMVGYRNGGDVSEDDSYPKELDAKFDALRTKTEEDLKKAFPDKDIKVIYKGKERGLNEQKEQFKKGSSTTKFGLHGIGAARDFNIIIDGRILGNSKSDHKIYQDYLWKNAENQGLYHLKKDEFGRIDPYHIGLVEEKGDGTAFKRLIEKYPQITKSKQFKNTVKEIQSIKGKNPSDTTYDVFLDSVKGSTPKSAPKINNKLNYNDDLSGIFKENKPIALQQKGVKRANSTGVASADKMIDDFYANPPKTQKELEEKIAKVKALTRSGDAPKNAEVSKFLSVANPMVEKFKTKSDSAYKANVALIEDGPDIIKNIQKLKDMGASDKIIKEYTEKAKAPNKGGLTIKYSPDDLFKKYRTKLKYEDFAANRNNVKAQMDRAVQDAYKKLDDVKKNPEKYTPEQINKAQETFDNIASYRDTQSARIDENDLDAYMDAKEMLGKMRKGSIVKTAEELSKTKQNPETKLAQTTKPKYELPTNVTERGTPSLSPSKGKSVSAPKTGLTFTPKMAEDNQEYPAVQGSESQSITEAIDPRFQEKNRLNDTQADLLTKSAQTVKPGETGYPDTPKKKGLADFLNKNWGSALEMGASAAQIGMGLKGLSEERPVDKIDPLFQANVDKAQAAAKYGFTPEENALLEQQNQSALNAARFAARNYAGGSAGTAYVQERNAINEGYGNALKKAIANKNLMMDKQQYADQMALQKAQMSRNLFGDKLNAWTQKQSSASELLGAGLSNLIGSQRYKDELEAYKQRQQQYGA